MHRREVIDAGAVQRQQVPGSRDVGVGLGALRGPDGQPLRLGLPEHGVAAIALGGLAGVTQLVGHPVRG